MALRPQYEKKICAILLTITAKMCHMLKFQNSVVKAEYYFRKFSPQNPSLLFNSGFSWPQNLLSVKKIKINVPDPSSNKKKIMF